MAFSAAIAKSYVPAMPNGKIRTKASSDFKPLPERFETASNFWKILRLCTRSMSGHVEDREV